MEPDRTGILLVVDDDPGVLSLHVRVLKRAGHVVDRATRGDEALQCLQNPKYEVVVLDLVLPDMNGAQVLECMKQQKITAVPIIVTGYPSDVTVSQTLALGALDYLQKPAFPCLLRAKVQQALAHRDAECLRARLSAIARLATNQQTLGDGVRTASGGNPGVPPHQRLSPRQYQVLCGIGAGESPKQIAARLSLSEKTVRSYRMTVRSKLGMLTDAALMRYALNEGLVT